MKRTVALNGHVRRWEELPLEEFAQGFFFGAGFFTTLLVHEGEPVLLERHLERLRASLAAYAGRVQGPPEGVLEVGAVREAVRRCLEADGDMGPRFTGVAKLVASDGRALLSFRALPADHERRLREGRSLEELEERSYRRGEPSLRHKSLSYLRQYAELGRMPLFLNEAGEVCETPIGNLFFLVDDAVVTPAVESPCLPGVARAVLLEAGRLGRWPVREEPVERARLGQVRGCFMTNSVVLAMPVPRLLGRELPESTALAEQARAVVWENALHATLPAHR